MPLDNLTSNAGRNGGDYVLPFDRVLVGKDPTKAGLVPAYQMVRVDTATATPASGADFAVFASAADTLRVEASAHYRFRMFGNVTTNASNSAALLFLFGGSATFTSIFYASLGVSATTGTSAAAAFNTHVVATERVIVVAAAATGKRFLLEGEFETNAAGTLIPTFNFDTDPGGVGTVDVGTTFEMWKTSDTAGLVSIGNFS